MNVPLIKKMIEKGYVSRRKHPTCDLWILNYTPQTQFDFEWNEATIVCRGLIVDAEWNIIARPLKKFFTIDQLTSIRNKVHHLYGRKFKDIFNERFITMEKIDGSLGILFYNPLLTKWEIATRGSFESDQAIEANKILQEKYNWLTFAIDCTYMVEIIYPENRIVVNYKNERALILLAVLNNDTGLDDWDEWSLMNKYMKFAKLYHINTIEELEAAPDRDNAEGYVLIFEDGFRLKFKYEEYKRLHYIMTSITEKKLWEWERDSYEIDPKNVPDEYFEWILSVQSGLRKKYRVIETEVWNKLNEVTIDPSWTRKYVANLIKDYRYRHIVFAMMDEHDYAKMIWKLLKPEG